MNIDIKAFIEDCRNRGLTEHTIATYRSNIATFLDFIGKLGIMSGFSAGGIPNPLNVDIPILCKFLEYLKEMEYRRGKLTKKGVHPKTIKAYFSAISTYGKGFVHSSANNIVKKLAKRAGLKKHVHPHLFRHSRLTILAKEFSESELKIIAGWTGSSNMAGVYIHLSGGDIEKKMLQKNGLLNKIDDPAKDILKPKSCSRCHEVNPNTARFCYVCGMALDAKPPVELEPHISDRDIEKKILAKHGIESKEPQTEDILSKGLLQFVIQKHPELVIEFLKNNGLDDPFLAVTPGKIKAAPVLVG